MFSQNTPVFLSEPGFTPAVTNCVNTGTLVLIIGLGKEGLQFYAERIKAEEKSPTPTGFAPAIFGDPEDSSVRPLAGNQRLTSRPRGRLLLRQTS